MCGIAGARASWHEARQAVEAMCEHMVPRGPDGGGLETFEQARRALVLGSRRLAIIDPTPDGDQPMSDPERGTTIVFNGMIYNFRELRDRLATEGLSFTSSCDTEVVLKAYGHFGISCVQHLRGMYAFAIWDARTQRLVLARDPLGIKPLYYAQPRGAFLFASQVRTLLASGLGEPVLSRPGIESFLAAGAVSEPLTAVEGIRCLPAGHTAVLQGERLHVERFWTPPEVVDGPASVAEAAGELRPLLVDAVRTHLVSDAPLGVFLSGGVDSSIVAGLAARETKQLRTISVTFDDPNLSEERYMQLMTARIGGDHVSVRLQPRELLGWLDGAFDAMDQPTFDGINTYVVSRAAASTELKVAVSGLGGDELFDGYGHVERARRLELLRRVPAPLRQAAAHAAARLAPAREEKLFEWLRSDDADGRSYELLRRLFLDGEIHALLRNPTTRAVPRPDRVNSMGDLARQISLLDLTNYLRNVLLRDTDAMGMSQSLEVRVPFLDQPLVEWTLALPAAARGRRKELLVAAARDVLPPELANRPKQGFLLPLAGWMRRELRDEVDRTLGRPPEALAEIVDREVALRLWERYLADGRRWLRPWALYALCRWTEEVTRAGAGVAAHTGAAP